MPRQSEIDWKPLRTEYITSAVTTKSLAERYGLKPKTVESRATREGWVEARKKYQQDCLERSVEDRTDKAVRQLNRLMDITANALEIATDALKDEKQFNRYIVTERRDGETVTEERIFEKLDTSAYKNMTKSIVELTGLTRELYDLPTPEEAERRQIARERLEMEKQRLAIGAEDGETGIVLLPECF